MKYLLHIDTSTDAGTIAVCGDGVVISCHTSQETRSHASLINGMIGKTLSDAGISLGLLDGVVVCAGPGSYTGLRIGLATAKGLCYALDKPLILDNKLSLLAYNACQKHPYYAQYISLLIAREKEYFIGIYDHDFHCMLPPQHVTEDIISGLAEKNISTYMVSDASKLFTDNLKIDNLQVDPDTKTELNSWAFYSFEKYNCNHFVNLMDAEPFYLKQVYTHK